MTQEPENGEIFEAPPPSVEEPEIEKFEFEEPEVEVPEVEVPEKEDLLSMPASPPETRLRKFFRLSIRWIAGLLIVFALGFLSAVFLLYSPLRSEKSRMEADLARAERSIVALEDEISQLESEIRVFKAREYELDAEVAALQAEVKNANIHILILSALSDINATRVSLMNEDVGVANVHLTMTMETLESLKNLVEPNQRDQVTTMQNRLVLVLEEMEDDPSTALYDLEVLANNLMVLENTFFAKP